MSIIKLRKVPELFSNHKCVRNNYDNYKPNYTVSQKKLSGFVFVSTSSNFYQF